MNVVTEENQIKCENVRVFDSDFYLAYTTVGKLKTNSAKRCNFLTVVDNLISKCNKNLEDLQAYI